jgi:hypothetical protein
MNSFENQQWLMIAMSFIFASIKAGNKYQPNEENNMAFCAVCVADSLYGSYSERFLQDEGGSKGGSSGPAEIKAISELLDKINKTDVASQTLEDFTEATMKIGVAQFKPAVIQEVENIVSSAPSSKLSHK